LPIPYCLGERIPEIGVPELSVDKVIHRDSSYSVIGHLGLFGPFATVWFCVLRLPVFHVLHSSLITTLFDNHSVSPIEGVGGAPS
jgi:hypothetical protein